MARPTITAVLNAHREGLIAKPSLESLKRNVTLAQRSSYDVEVIIILDRADRWCDLTQLLLEQAGAAGRVVDLRHEP